MPEKISRWQTLQGGLIVVLAAAALAVTPYQASELAIVPDSVEYAVAAGRVAALNGYTITINQQVFPPRYPPWFSCLILAPVYRVLGPEPGHAVLPVMAFGILGVWLAFRIGCRLSGSWGGMFAALLVLLLPGYRDYSGQVMTDVPSAVLAVLACGVYLSARFRQTPGRMLAAGMVCALSVALRPATITLLIPFLLVLRKQPIRQALTSLLLVSSPVVLVMGATAYYNHHAFGSAWRSGYHYWCSVPYDYFHLTFSVRYLGDNLAALLASGLPALILLVLLVVAWTRRQGVAVPASGYDSAVPALLQFAVPAVGPVIVLHLVYFYPDPRFFLGGVVLLAILAGGYVGRLMPERSSRLMMPALGAALVMVIVIRSLAGVEAPVRRMLADAMREHTPADAVILSAIDPVYLDHLAGAGGTRHFIPLSRQVEYASKRITPVRIPDPVPRPRDAFDHRCAGLTVPPACEVFDWVVAEQMDRVQDLVEAGRPVFVATGMLAPQDAAVVDQLVERFVPLERAPGLYELTQRTDDGL